MLSIKRKFLVDLIALLVLIFVIGAVMIIQVKHLGNSIDVILRENYQSVILCQRFNDTLEKINDNFLRAFAENSNADSKFLREQLEELKKIWRAERANITVEGEKEQVAEVERLLADYSNIMKKITSPGLTLAERKNIYRNEISPVSVELCKYADNIMELNQKNMISANNRARKEAELFYNRMLIVLLGCIVFAILQMLLLRQWIEKPIRKLTELTTEIAGGNLDIVLNSDAGDEIGQLSRAFNSMATALRKTRRSEQMKLELSERTNQDIFKELPTPIAVFNVHTEQVEIATQSAERHFGLKTGVNFKELDIAWLNDLYIKVLQTGMIVAAPDSKKGIRFFIENREYFFQPIALPIPSGVPKEQISSVAVILKDITMAHEQRELKRSVLSTVSHQLKTPLTSLQMSIYLLLEEKIGNLSNDQLELVMSMRDDAERLTAIINDLLNLNRAGTQKHFKLEKRRANVLLQEAKERFYSVCLDKDIKLILETEQNLPDILIPVDRINYIFDNLIDNAIRFTPAGGMITLSAEVIGESIKFMVKDTGSGMSDEVQKHLFEQFYRASNQEASSGVGLGLSIVKEIITALNGSIDVESSPGCGSTFTFILPLTQEQQTERSSIIW